MLKQTFFPNRSSNNNSGNGWGLFFVVLAVAGTTGYFAYRMHKVNSLKLKQDEQSPTNK